jgi:dTDP-D-glucose 4,6-dehydratase
LFSEHQLNKYSKISIEILEKINFRKMTQYEPKRVLITGGCGFIGANFVNFIHNAWPHANFVNVDKLILNSDINYVAEHVRNSSRYKLVLADIKNKVAMKQVLEENEVTHTVVVDVV